MNIKLKLGTRLNLNMKRSLNLWKKKSVPSLEKRSSQKNLLLHNFLENFKDGKAFLVKTLSKENSRMKEKVS